MYYTAALHEKGIDPGAPTLARRSHVLWLIEHRPESALAGAYEARLSPGPLGPAGEQGYQQARQLWRDLANKPGASPEILTNASRFFEMADMPMVEEMLLRAPGRDPQGPWSRRLGRLYAVVLVGDSTTVAEHPRFMILPGESSYAESIMRKLAQNTDDLLLLAAAEHILLRPYPGIRFVDGGRQAYRFDPREMARSHIERALQINPQSLFARVHLESLRRHERLEQREELLDGVPLVGLHDAVSALPAAQRFSIVSDLAIETYERAIAAARTHPDLSDYLKIQDYPIRTVMSGPSPTPTWANTSASRAISRGSSREIL